MAARCSCSASSITSSTTTNSATSRSSTAFAVTMIPSKVRAQHQPLSPVLPAAVHLHKYSRTSTLTRLTSCVLACMLVLCAPRAEARFIFKMPPHFPYPYPPLHKCSGYACISARVPSRRAHPCGHARLRHYDQAQVRSQVYPWRSERTEEEQKKMGWKEKLCVRVTGQRAVVPGYRLGYVYHASHHEQFASLRRTAS